MKTVIKIGILLSLNMFWACERDTEIEGPELVDLFADFEFVENLKLTRNSVDFTTQDVVFNAKFNKLTTWELTIIGLESQAVKRFQGVSRQMDETNAQWIGATTQLPMFKAEKCLIDLHILDDSTHVTDTVEITVPKVNEGFVVADFEDGAINPKWEDPFLQSGANMSFRVVNDTVAGQGDFYYDMGGAVSWDYLIGLVYMDADAYGAPAFPLASNPENVYFNFMLWVPDEITNAIVLFRFNEDDNGDGAFNANEEDQWSYELQDFESGWQLISIKYSDLQYLVNGQPADPNGNALHNPDKLNQVELLFLADPSTGYSQAFLDYVIFTEGGPLNP